MKPHKLPLTLLAVLLPWISAAQEAPLPALPPLDPLQAPSAAPAAAPPAHGLIPAPTPAPSPEAGEIRLNFQGAALSDVLNYLSEAAGFIIVQDVPVTGTVSVVSRRPISADEAVDLLNTVLLGKGYVAIRNGRILKIVNRKDAQTKDIPVVTGADPDQIPRKDAMVTQILPVRYVDVTKLVDNLRPLLDPNATIGANEGSNAILLTDTQVDIHRMAEIIRALDTSVSSISTIHVYPLRYADAKDLAGVITQLFAADSAKPGENNQQPPFGGGGGFMRRMFGGGAPAPTPASEARQAVSRVVAVADEQSNSIIVSAPDELMATISEIVSRVDTNISDVTETRIFRLLHADAVELSGVLTSLYTDPSATPGQNNNNRNNGGGGGGGFGGQGFGQFQRQQSQGGNQQTSQRAILQARVVAVPDARTNSIIVSSSRDTMEQIALTIGRLDASDSKKQHVYIYTLDHADPDNVASILRGMFSVDSSSATANQPSTSRLTERTTTGASSEVGDTLNTNGNSNGGGGGGRSGSFRPLISPYPL